MPKFLLKGLRLLILIIFIGGISFRASAADDPSIALILTAIKNTTDQILTVVNASSVYIGQLVDAQPAKDWATLQENFTALGVFKGADKTSTDKLTNDFLTKANEGKLPSNVNSLSFLTSMTKTDDVDGYIMNAAGLNLKLPPPRNDGFTNNTAANADYNALRDTISSVQSFNAFIMKNFYANLSNRQPAVDLMQSTSDPTWIMKVASEPMGQVFRQMLLYLSQTYVLLNRIAENQQYTLASQAMTNTLLIAMNQGGAKLAQSLPQTPTPETLPPAADTTTTPSTGTGTTPATPAS